MSLYKDFNSKIKKDLKKKLDKKNIYEVPYIFKIIVSMGIWSLVTRKWEKDFSSFEEVLKKITWQKPYIIKSKKAISNFKLREDMPVMLKVTIRNDHAYDFIDRLSKLILPRVRDFVWLNTSKFDWRWDFNLWLKNLSAFPELTPEEMSLAMWLQINICTTANNDTDAKALLESLWLIFK